MTGNSPKSTRTASRRPRRTGLKGAELIRVERACGDLRAGMPILVSGAQNWALSMAVETLEIARLTEIAVHLKGIQAYALVTPTRAAALKIRIYTESAVAAPIASDIDTLMAQKTLGDPARDLDYPLRGPFQSLRGPLPPNAPATLALIKAAGLLPAALAWFISEAEGKSLVRKLGLLTVGQSEIEEYQPRAAALMTMVASAQLPLNGAERSRILAFRPPSGAREHLALLIGDPSPDGETLVRLHSECLTGDLLGSLKCDCGDQLRGAIARMGQEPGGGVLLYLAQEGRGIGLINKLRAYSLQDQGFDTIEANTRLGFEPDERSFRVAAEILKRLGFQKIRLLTNNPDKIAGLEHEGIEVTARVPHAFPENPFNRDYLAVKSRKAGHLL